MIVQPFTRIAGADFRLGNYFSGAKTSRGTYSIRLADYAGYSPLATLTDSETITINKNGDYLLEIQGFLSVVFVRRTINSPTASLSLLHNSTILSSVSYAVHSGASGTVTKSNFVIIPFWNGSSEVFQDQSGTSAVINRTLTGNYLRSVVIRASQGDVIRWNLVLGGDDNSDPTSVRLANFSTKLSLLT